MSSMSMELDECMDTLERTQKHCTAFFTKIASLEADELNMLDSRKEARADRKKEEEKSTIRGMATALKLEDLTTSISAQDIRLWMEKWE